MDPLSFALLLASAPASSEAPLEAAERLTRQLFAQPETMNVTTVILLLMAGVVIQILAYWIAAKVVVGHEAATFARAAYLWLLILLTGIGMGIVLAICMALAASTEQPVLILLVGGGCLLLAFALALLLPAKVFETNLLRSLGILVLSLLLVLAGQTALDQALGRSTLARWQPVQKMIFDSNEGRQRQLQRLLSGTPRSTLDEDLDRLAQPAERAKTFTERQEALRVVFTALEHRRKAIKPGDREALASYEATRQRYEELVKIMRADYAAKQTPPPLHPAQPPAR